jgi:predicted nuclease with TOPRIM domain
MRQPELIFSYSEEAAKAKKELDLLRERVDICRAELSKKIRTTPEVFGIAKLTEAVIESTIVLQPEYQELSQKFIEKKFDVDDLSSAVKALDQKKSALENLVRLLSLSYFSSPKANSELGKYKISVVDSFQEGIEAKQKAINNLVQINKEEEQE